jgi:hypothetical protein
VQRFEMSRRIIPKSKSNPTGKIVKRGKIKVWTGAVPSIPLAKAVRQARHYAR